jgi:adenosylcobyric acid synthase
MFKEYCDIPFAGVVPYMKLSLDEEDSLSDILKDRDGFSDDGKVNIAVIKLPFISNYTDYSIFENIEDVELIYTQEAKAIAGADLVIIPGTKNTLSDLRWMRERELDKAVKAAAPGCIPVVGICGGFQILGRTVADETEPAGKETGLGLLPVDTTFAQEKELKQVEGILPDIEGPFAHLSGRKYSGYEIHMGRTGAVAGGTQVITNGNVLGTYIHGFFDRTEIAEAVLGMLFEKKGIKKTVPRPESHLETQEKELDKLAACLKENLDMDLIYRAIGI